MSVFVFAAAEYKDKAEYARYVSLSTPIFLREGVKVHGNDEAARFVEMPGDKAVLLEFRDMDHLKHFFSLEDYQAAAKHRDAGATMRTATFRRFPLPS
jgi:uncharacterized protein (DUF1330 family)